MTGAVASTYHDVKESARATVTDLEESAKSAMDRLRARLDADMEPHNFVDDRLSMGLIPSNTEVRQKLWGLSHSNIEDFSSYASSLLLSSQ